MGRVERRDVAASTNWEVGCMVATGREGESSHMSNVRRGMEEKKFLRLKPTRHTFPTQVVGLVRRGGRKKTMISYSLPYIWRWRGDLRLWNGKSCC